MVLLMILRIDKISSQLSKSGESIRESRNILLAQTDFYALSDVTMTTEMSNYRQQLRDLPASQSDPDDVVFPTKPYGLNMALSTIGTNSIFRQCSHCS